MSYKYWNPVKVPNHKICVIIRISFDFLSFVVWAWTPEQRRAGPGLGPLRRFGAWARVLGPNNVKNMELPEQI